MKPTARPIAELVIGAAWLLGLTAALLLAEGLLHKVPIARAVLTALAASVAVGRAGVVWDERDPQGADTKRSIRQGLVGAARAALAAFAGAGVALAAGWANLRTGWPGFGVLLALATAFATSVREELVYRALPFHFGKRAGVREEALVIFTALLSPSAFVLSPGVSPSAVALSASFGFLSARLLARTGSLWSSVASSFVARVVLGPGLGALLFSFDWQKGEASLGPIAGGPAAWVVAGLALAVGVFGVRGVGSEEAPAREAAPKVRGKR